MSFKNIFILFIIFASFVLGQKFDLNTYATLGYDSNPMKLSEDELDESIDDLFLNKYLSKISTVATEDIALIEEDSVDIAAAKHPAKIIPATPAGILVRIK